MRVEKKGIRAMANAPFGFKQPAAGKTAFTL